MVQRIAFRVHGRVQGVSYRYFTRKHAAECSVTGWVRNESGGMVQGEAQGTQDSLKTFFGYLQRGPSHAIVENIEKDDIAAAEGEKGFQILV